MSEGESASKPRKIRLSELLWRHATESRAELDAAAKIFSGAVGSLIPLPEIVVPQGLLNRDITDPFVHDPVDNRRGAAIQARPQPPPLDRRTERLQLWREFKRKAKAASIHVNDAMIAKAARSTWNTRSMITWWKLNDPRCTLAHDREIRAVLARDPKTIWPRG